jgi:hypothetical protein
MFRLPLTNSPNYGLLRRTSEVLGLTIGDNSVHSSGNPSNIIILLIKLN